jgi:hypothetical protein
MAEPTIALQLNEGSEGTPTWVGIGTAKWTGPDGVGDPFVAPVLDATDVFFDNTTAPNDGELWNDDGSPVQVAAAGRALNANVLRALETGGTDGTADPPELSAYDDVTDAGNRTAPATWLLVGTAGTSSVGCIRGVETTAGAPAAGWGTQTHDGAPSVGAVLEGNVTKVTCASALAASGNKLFNVAHANPHDATSDTTTWVKCLMYTYV